MCKRAALGWNQQLKQKNLCVETYSWFKILKKGEETFLHEMKRLELKKSNNRNAQNLIQKFSPLMCGLIDEVRSEFALSRTSPTIPNLSEWVKNAQENQKQFIHDEELVNSYYLASMYDKPMRTLSGGTTQKVSAALAFLFNPKVLILDEPTAGLDPLAAEMLKAKILKAKNEGKLIIITSHIMSEVEEIADKIMYLFEGKINFYKTVAELKQETGEEKLGKAVASIMKLQVNS